MRLRGIALDVFAPGSEESRPVRNRRAILGAAVASVAVAMNTFGGRATYSGGTTLPENREDLSDLVTLVTPAETTLLDALGDGLSPAISTKHEWIEDDLNYVTATVSDASIANAATETTFDLTAGHGARLRVGDMLYHASPPTEIMLVTAIATDALTVTRNYGSSTNQNLVTADTLVVIGNAELEGADAAAARFRARTRKSNYTQIFTETVEVSGSEAAIQPAGVTEGEYEYQKKLRLTEQLRLLERSIIYSRLPAANPEGSSTVRRTMKGIVQWIATNIFTANSTAGFSVTALTLADVQLALKNIFAGSSLIPDLLVCSPNQRYNLASGLQAGRVYSVMDDAQRNVITYIETDFGRVQLVTCRSLDAKHALFLKKSLIQIKPLVNRSFFHLPAAEAGDRKKGQNIGEYTLEFRAEAAHALYKAA